MMFDLRSLLQKSIERAGINKQVEAHQVVRAFNELSPKILGDKLKDGVMAINVRDKILSVACLSSIMAQELRFKEKEIIDALNEKFEKEVVKKIKYVL